MTMLEQHTFPNGDQLMVNAKDWRESGVGVMTFEVFYAEKVGEDVFETIGCEVFVSESAADAAFVKRKESRRPAEVVGMHDAFTVIYEAGHLLGEKALPLPTEKVEPGNWDSSYELILKNLIGDKSSSFYEAEALFEALSMLTTTSSDRSGGKADEMFSLPAWKLREILIGYTALAMRVQAQKIEINDLRPRKPRKTAA